MRPRLASILLAVVLAVCPWTTSLQAQSTEQQERIGASFILALGRAPSDEELERVVRQGALSVAELIARHRQQLERDGAMNRATIIRACQDAFGREPREEEIKAWSGESGVRTYTELMQRHIQWLAEHPTDYVEVMHRAYRLLVRRDAYPEEIDYWKQRDTLSYALLAGCIEDWARRNQPGLMVTTGTPTISVNSEFLSTIRLSPAVAAEARAAAGLVSADGVPAPASGRNLVAAGAGSVATGGRIHFVAAGSANLLPRHASNR